MQQVNGRPATRLHLSLDYGATSALDPTTHASGAIIAVFLL
jgi:hypothetical protein